MGGEAYRVDFVVAGRERARSPKDLKARASHCQARTKPNRQTTREGRLTSRKRETLVNLETLLRNLEEKFVNVWIAVAGFPHLLLNPLKMKEKKKDSTSLISMEKIGCTLYFCFITFFIE